VKKGIEVVFSFCSYVKLAVRKYKLPTPLEVIVSSSLLWTKNFPAIIVLASRKHGLEPSD